MKKNKGFTLIELLAVIVILGILLSISIVSVNKIRQVQEKNNENNVISSILTGAKNYIADNREKLNDLNNLEINVSDLVGQYVDLDKNILNITNEKVLIKPCSNNLKLLYYIEIKGKIYNDCGCASQEKGATNSYGTSAKLCTGNTCTEDSCPALAD